MHEKMAHRGPKWSEMPLQASSYPQEGRVAHKAKLAKLVEPCNHAALIQQSKSNGFH